MSRRTGWLTAVLLMLAMGGTARADFETNGGGWLMGMGQGSFERLSPRLERALWWLDAQARFREDFGGFNQSLVRPGLGWAFGGDWSLWLGYAWVHTRGVVTDSDEHRLWQQLLWVHRLGSLSAQSRTRLEQRWLNTGDDTGWRLREFVKLGYPLPFAPRLSVVGYDEVFFDLNDTDWGQSAGFDQNRLFAGLAWRVDAGGRLVLELGYLNQIIRRDRLSDRMNHLVSFNILVK